MLSIISGLGKMQHKNVGMSKSMFNKKNKSPLLSKKFSSGSKGMRMKSSKSKSMGDMESSDISPSADEFDSMMSKSLGKSPSKKSMFRKKF
jgi:hypothetical protein